ncbi:hypothetical protein AAMO2058_001600200, partial [Amorphochlora amoebiformis]
MGVDNGNRTCDAPQRRPAKLPRFTAPSSFLSRWMFLVYVCTVIIKVGATTTSENSVNYQGPLKGHHVDTLHGQIHDNPEDTDNLPANHDRLGYINTPSPPSPTSYDDMRAYTSPPRQASSPLSTSNLLSHINLLNIDDMPVTNDHSEFWNVTYHGTFKEAWNVQTKQQYILYNNVTLAPPSSAYPSARFFQIPLQSVAVAETVAATFMEMLGLREVIRFMGLTYVTSGCLRVLGAQGAIEPFEGDPRFGANSTKRNIQIASVDAVIASEFDSQGTTDSKFITYSATADPGTLHRAEWIEFLSLFFDKELEASLSFNGTVERYNCHRAGAQSEDRFLSGNKTVAWLAYSSFSKSFRVDTTAYKRQFTEDAGGIFFTPSQSSYSSASALAAVLGDVDVVIDQSYYYDLNTANLASFCSAFGLSPCNTSSPFKFLQTMNVWRFDKLTNGLVNAGLDWFESSIPEPDVVLEDLSSILYPNLQPLHQRTWFRNIAVGESINIEPASCVNTSAVRSTRADSCPTYYIQRSTVDFSQDWNITYYANHKVVWNRRANVQYVLFEKGTTPPTTLYPGARFLPIPLQTIAVSDTTVTTILELLGVQDRITYMDLTYVTSGCLRVRGMQGIITSFEGDPAYGGNTTTRNAQISGVDAVIGNSFDSNSSASNFIIYSSTSDPGTLNRAEWIEYIGVFFNKELEASQAINGTIERYNCHSGAARLSAGSQTVAWVSKSGSSFIVSTSEYKRQFTEDAGAVFLNPSTSFFTDANEFYNTIIEVDVLIDEAYFADPAS